MRKLAVVTVLLFCVVYAVAVTLAATANTVIKRSAGSSESIVIAEGKAS